MSMMLKSLRARYGEKQEDLAKYLDITTTTFCHKEKGKKDFTLTEARKLAERYNMSIEEIFFDNELSKRQQAN